MSPICFGEPTLTVSPASVLISACSPPHSCANSPDSRDQNLPVDADTTPLHAREHFQERPLQRLIDIRHMLGGKPRLEHAPQPQGRVGVLGGVFGRLGDVDAIERQLALADFGDFVEIDGLVIEVAPRQRVKAMVGAPGIEDIGHQHGVVVGRDLDAAQGENLPVEFQVLADLEHAAVFQDRLHGRQRIGFGELVGRDLAGKQRILAALAAVPMRQWHIAGLVRRHREREAA